MDKSPAGLNLGGCLFHYMFNAFSLLEGKPKAELAYVDLTSMTEMFTSDSV